MTPRLRGSRARRRSPAPLAPPRPEPSVEATLYSAAQPLRAVALEELAALRPAHDQLLWVHLTAPGAEQTRALAEALRLPGPAGRFIADIDGEPELRNFRTCFGVRVHEADFVEGVGCRALPLVIVCGSNLLLSVSEERLDCVDELRERQRQNVEVGSLTAESFMVSLLDGQLSTYFESMSRLESAVEQMEMSILADKQEDCLAPLRHLRHASSRLRRILAAHRNVFAGLARPDFQPNQAQEVNQHYALLDSRYDRAMDVVEHGRDLVVGSFELFTTRAAMSTNHTMQVLTFVTVLIGGLAVFAGVLGMNVDTPYFETGVRGFWWAVGSMAVISIAASVLARSRGWL